MDIHGVVCTQTHRHTDTHKHMRMHACTHSCAQQHNHIHKSMHAVAQANIVAWQSTQIYTHSKQRKQAHNKDTYTHYIDTHNSISLTHTNKETNTHTHTHTDTCSYIHSAIQSSKHMKICTFFFLTLIY